MPTTAGKSNAPVDSCKATINESCQKGQRQLASLANAATTLPVPVHPATLLRWIKDGLDGRKLPAERIGARWFVDPADLTAFLDACNG